MLFGNLPISQGCYSIAVKASARTHAKGGVLDLDDWTEFHADADAVFTSCGWIAFWRPPNALYPGSPGHWHVVLNGCPHLHPEAQAQLDDAVLGLNGLAGKGKDEGPRPGITWQQAVAEDRGDTIEEDDMAFKTILVSTSGGGPAEQVLVAWDGLVGVCEGEEYACVKRLATAVDGQLVNGREKDVAIGWRTRVSGVAALLADEDPRAIAAQIVAALPGHIAEQVVDELRQRLAS